MGEEEQNVKRFLSNAESRFKYKRIGEGKGTDKNKVQLYIKYGNLMMNHLFYILTKTINKEKKNTS